MAPTRRLFIGRFVATLVLLGAALVGVAPAPVAGQSSTAAYFVFDYPPSPEAFVIKLTNPERIAEARAILTGDETDAVHVMGRIVKEPAPYNPQWSYHLDPDSITFFAFAIEVCDAGIRYVEDHLDEAGGAFLPGLVWCPWGSRLLSEIPLQ